VVVGGAFTNINGVSQSLVARLNVDGSLDTGFTTGRALEVSRQPRGEYAGLAA